MSDCPVCNCELDGLYCWSCQDMTGKKPLVANSKTEALRFKHQAPDREVVMKDKPVDDVLSKAVDRLKQCCNEQIPWEHECYMRDDGRSPKFKFEADCYLVSMWYIRKPDHSELVREAEKWVEDSWEGKVDHADDLITRLTEALK